MFQRFTRQLPDRQVACAFLMVNIALGPLVALTLYRSRIAVDLGVPQFAVGGLYGAYFVAAGTCGRFILPHLARFEFRHLLLFGAFGLVVGSAICSYLMSSIAFFCCFVIAVGLVGGAPYMAPLADHVMSRMQARPTFAFAVATLGQLTAFGFWGVLFESMMSEDDWRRAFRIVSIIATVSLPVLAWSMRHDAEAGMPILPSGRILIRAPWYLAQRVAVGYAFIGAAGTIVITNLRAVADAAGASSFIIVVFSAASIVGRLGASHVFDFGGRLAMMLGTAALLVASCALFTLTNRVAAMAFVGAALFGVAYGGFLPVALVWVRRTYPHRRADVSSLMFYWGGIGVAAGSIASGAFGRGDNVFDPLLTAFACSLLGAAAWAHFSWVTRKSWDG
jgi:MFS family permease